MSVAEYDLYRRIKLLGEGSFGKAFLVECLTDGTYCVIKQVNISRMTEEEKKNTLIEAKILEALQHPNIVKFREVYKTKKGKLCIVMDYADGGDLANKIKAQRGQPFPESQILDWFTQICLALKHVHDRKIIHRDLKCQNIFLTKTNIVKLGDFGIARVLSNTRENAKTLVGTPYYLSPEIIENKPYSLKSDIWSLGVILYELCALKPPFTGDSLPFLALKIVRGSYTPIPSQYSKDLKNLVGSLLQTDPNKRPAANTILALPFIQARIKNFLSESVVITEFSHTILHKQKMNLGSTKLDNVKSVNDATTATPQAGIIQRLKQPSQQKPAGKPSQQHQGPSHVQNNVKNQPVQDQKLLAEQRNRIIQNIIAKKEEEKQAQQISVQQNNQANAKQNNNLPQQGAKQRLLPDNIYQLASDTNSPLMLAQNREPNKAAQYDSAPTKQPVKAKIAPKGQGGIFKSTAERNILGGMGGGALFSEEALQNVGRKREVSDPKKGMKPVEKKVVPEKKKEPRPSKDMQNDILSKFISNNKKVEEDLACKKEEAEKKRLEREKERNAMRQQMQVDIKNKRKQGKGEIKVEFFGMKLDEQEPSTNISASTQETAAESHQGELAEKNDNTDFESKQTELEKRSGSNSPQKRPSKVLWNVDIANFQSKNRQMEAKEQKKRILYEDPDAEKNDPNDKFKIEIYMPSRPRESYYGNVETNDSKSVESGEKSKDADEDNKSLSRGEESPTKLSKKSSPEKTDPSEEEKEDKSVELGEDEHTQELAKQVEEEFVTFEALIQELNELVTKPESLASNPEYTLNKGELHKILEKYEDREDDFDDEPHIHQPHESPVSKKQQPRTSIIQKKEEILANEGLDYITDYSKLENLKIILEDSLGDEAFLKAYRILKDLFHKKADLEELEQKYGKDDCYESLFPFIPKQSREKYLPLMFTFVIMEDIAEETSFQHSQN